MGRNDKGKSMYNQYQKEIDLLMKETNSHIESARQLKAKYNLPQELDTIRQGIRKVIKNFATDPLPSAKVSVLPPVINLPPSKPILNLPESFAAKKVNYVLPIANDNILVISDIHVPYHDNSAITLAIEYGVRENINTIIINGDLLDFATISRFAPDPEARDVQVEFEAAQMFLKCLREVFPYAMIIWLKGNHDERYETYLYQKARELAGDPYFTLENRLNLAEFKVELVDAKILIKAGKLNITHGHLLIRGVFAPVNAARGAYLRAKASVLIGHVHNTTEHTEGNLDDEIKTCWSTGCLCNLNPPYDPLNTKHNHGFAHIKTKPEGAFSVKNIRIHEGKIL
jgi:predicted phosphodiesterase